MTLAEAILFAHSGRLRRFSREEYALALLGVHSGSIGGLVFSQDGFLAVGARKSCLAGFGFGDFAEVVLCGRFGGRGRLWSSTTVAALVVLLDHACYLAGGLGREFAQIFDFALTVLAAGRQLRALLARIHGCWGALGVEESAGREEVSLLLKRKGPVNSD